MIQNHITRLIAQLKSDDYYVRYPQLLDKSNKKHVLFFAPFANATGLYRVILPYQQLNRTSTHSAIITELIPNTQKNRDSMQEWHTSDPIIEWADYIVFPTASDDLTENIKLLRSINKKPHLKFVFDIDDNYHIEEANQDKKLAAESQQAILNNMAMCDIVTTTNAYLGTFYLNLLNQHQITNNQQLKTIFLLMPNFISDDYLENIKITEPQPTKIRIGITIHRSQKQFADLLLIRKILLNAQKKYKDKIEFVLFGWNGRIMQNGTMKDALQGIKHTYIESVEIHQYFNKLANLQLDFALMPLHNTPFNNSKSHHKLLQYAQFGIPAIVSDTLPYNEILAPEGQSMFTPGYLPALKCKNEEDWTKAIDFLIENTEARKNISEKAKVFVNQEFNLKNKSYYHANVYK